jgi:hypothetical protein
LSDLFSVFLLVAPFFSCITCASHRVGTVLVVGYIYVVWACFDRGETSDCSDSIYV